MADAEIESNPVNQDALVADIDRTRAELARTINAISDRVSPKKNVDRVTEQMRLRQARSTRSWPAPPPRRSLSASVSCSCGAAGGADGTAQTLTAQRRR